MLSPAIPSDRAVLTLCLAGDFVASTTTNSDSMLHQDYFRQFHVLPLFRRASKRAGALGLLSRWIETNVSCFRLTSSGLNHGLNHVDASNRRDLDMMHAPDSSEQVQQLFVELVAKRLLHLEQLPLVSSVQFPPVLCIASTCRD